mmetsp:Transcript_77492/g.185799  ORF Transcript_77492/g.185799 Transcript_77492/m.185799 type:complete len:562 (+) Transcript_77492:60-1745(+)
MQTKALDEAWLDAGWRVKQGRRRRTVAVPAVHAEAASRMLQQRKFRRSKTTSEAESAARDHFELSYASRSPTEDKAMSDILKEFDEDFKGFVRRPRLPTPPQWVPPGGGSALPKATLRPISPAQAPCLPDLSRDRDDMLSNVLNSLLPAGPSSKLASKELSPCSQLSPVSPAPRNAPCKEVLEFIHVLIRHFGNLNRAFRALKNAASLEGKVGPLEPLSRAEFEWCVTSFLQHGNRRLASKLFEALGGDLGLSNVEAWPSWPQLWRQLQPLSLELQELLEEGSAEDSDTRTEVKVSKQRFMKAAKALELDPCQAVHLFHLLDEGGHFRAGALQEALWCPKDLAWRDLRIRLVARFRTLEHALQALEELEDEDLVSCVQSFGLEADAELLEPEDEPHKVLQGAATKTRLEDFWRRVAAEWPEVAEACGDLEQLGQLLQELVPRPADGFLDLEAFTSLAQLVDVAPSDCEVLFRVAGRDGKVFLEDFAEQLVLWTGALGPKKEAAKALVAPARRLLSALKQELLPAANEEPVRLPTNGRPKKKRPKLPWVTNYRRPSLMALGA